MGSLFKILMDASNNPFALSKVVLGDAISASLNGIVVFGFRDSSGNATLPQLNPEGALPVTLDSGTTIRGSAILAEGSQTKNVEAEALVIDLTAEKNYSKMSVDVSNYRDSLFRVVAIDDYSGTPAETELGYALVGAGNNHAKIGLAVDAFNTIGGTGDQKLVVYHTPHDKESDAYVSASVNEIA